MSQQSESFAQIREPSGAADARSDARALAGWPSVVGGVLLAVPFLRGIAGELGLPFLQDPGAAPLAIVAWAAGAFALAFSMIGWWSVVGHSILGRAAIVGLGIGLALWGLDEVMLLAPDAIRFSVGFGLYLALVGLGSLVLAIDLRRSHALPIDGLVLVGIGGPLTAALLGAPWPLGLGPIVPGIAVLYAIGWIRLGMGIVQTARRDSA
ncbi:MAG TPA: hypothetical protein VGJ60_32505 [Chloroflexota bacterium]|jgi:hypothetical protein